MKNSSITKGNIAKALSLYFLPVWVGTFFQYFYNTADAVIVGNFLGTNALAAVGGPSAMMVNLFVGFFVGLGTGASVLVSQFYGAKDEKNTQRAVQAAMALGIISGVIMAVLGITLSPLILRLTNTPQELVGMAMQYITIYFFGIIFMVVYNLGSSILRAIGDSRRPLIFLIISSIINIVLDIVFIVIIPMGIAGVALATVISQAISAVCVLVTLAKSGECYRLNIKKIYPHLDLLKGMMRIGVPTGIQISFYTISALIIQSSVNAFGTDTIAAWSAYIKVDGIIWMTLSAIGITITTFSGQNFGARQVLRVRKGIRFAMVFAVLACLGMAAIMLSFAPNMLMLFVDDEHVIAIGVRMMVSVIPYYALFAPVEILGGALRGAGDTFVPTIAQILFIGVLRMAWMLFVLPLNNTVEVLSYAYPVSWCITSVVISVYYLKSKWVEKGLARLEKIVE